MYIWQNQSPRKETQQDDQAVLQITLQEVIDLIDTTAYEETMVSNGSHEETMVSNGSHEKTMVSNGSYEETMGDDDLQWFDWVV